jgi:transposase-like protein
MSKYKSDYERLETVKSFKVSKKTIGQFAKEKGIARETLRDWVNAFDNIDGSFIKLNKAIGSNEDSVLLKNEDITVKMLDSEQIYKKSRHFTRFDHSVVVIEYEKIKVTTSLEQALVILGKYDDQFK